jgi:putative SOS response-associated peptidase YedK
MCGRYSLDTPDTRVAKQFQADLFESFKPRFNILPTTKAPIVRINPDTGKRELVQVKWGMPFFNMEKKEYIFKLINAVGETIAEKKTFSKHFREDRALIPTTGFFEWKAITEKIKQPYFISLKTNDTFALAGIWGRWNMTVDDEETIIKKKKTNPKYVPKKEVVETFSIITTTPNKLLTEIHNTKPRMPIILDQKNWDAWLDRDLQEPGTLKGFLRPYPDEKMQAWPVKKLSGDDPSLIKKLKLP